MLRTRPVLRQGCEGKAWLPLLLHKFIFRMARWVKGWVTNSGSWVSESNVTQSHGERTVNKCGLVRAAPQVTDGATWTGGLWPPSTDGPHRRCRRIPETFPESKPGSEGLCLHNFRRVLIRLQTLRTEGSHLL